jgi:type I restriction enzyme R subunit
VLDFVGIFEKLEQALAFDSDVVASVIQNVDVLKKLFETWMREAVPDYLPLARGFDDKAKERAIDHFAEGSKREEFFKQLQGLYDILSPDAFLRPFLEDYLALSELFALIRNAFADRPYADREMTAKTRAVTAVHRRPAPANAGGGSRTRRRRAGRPEAERYVRRRQDTEPAQAVGRGRPAGRYGQAVPDLHR